MILSTRNHRSMFRADSKQNLDDLTILQNFA